MAEDSKPNFTGKYKHVKADNIDAFLRADGVGFMQRKLMTAMNADLEITQDGDKFTLRMKTPMFTKETNFTVGEDYEEELGRSGNVMKCVPSWDGNKLVVQLTPKVDGKGHAQTHTRYLEGDEMLMEQQIGDVKAVRHFKKV